MSAYLHALGHVDLGDRAQVYWAGRSCLTSSRGDVEIYDEAFERHFLRPGDAPPRTNPSSARPAAESQQPSRLAVGAAVEEIPGRQTHGPGRTIASVVETLRRKRFAECTEQELAEIARAVAQLRLAMPRCRTRRAVPSMRGRLPDIRRAMRQALRAHGELVRLPRRQRRERPRRLVLLLDVSGSMARSSRELLRFAHAVAASLRDIEVFCFGTRLTRVTGALRHRDVDAALAGAAAAVPDWDGGTQIGRSLWALARHWGRRGVTRGSIVVICSDGLERGDPERLRKEMERLARRAHRIVWINPLKADPAYQPLARGMRAALPFIDAFTALRDLASIEELAELLPRLAGSRRTTARRGRAAAAARSAR